MNEFDVLETMCQACRGVPFDEKLPGWVYDEHSECKCGGGYLPSPEFFAYEDIGEFMG